MSLEVKKNWRQRSIPLAAVIAIFPSSAWAAPLLDPNFKCPQNVHAEDVPAVEAPKYCADFYLRSDLASSPAVTAAKKACERFFVDALSGRNALCSYVALSEKFAARVTALKNDPSIGKANASLGAIATMQSEAKAFHEKSLNELETFYNSLQASYKAYGEALANLGGFTSRAVDQEMQCLPRESSGPGVLLTGIGLRALNSRALAYTLVSSQLNQLSLSLDKIGMAEGVVSQKAGRAAEGLDSQLHPNAPTSPTEIAASRLKAAQEEEVGQSFLSGFVGLAFRWWLGRKIDAGNVAAAGTTAILTANVAVGMGMAGGLAIGSAISIPVFGIERKIRSDFARARAYKIWAAQQIQGNPQITSSELARNYARERGKACNL